MTIVLDRREYEQALALAKGNYQRLIVTGHESLSGSTLRGAAAKDYVSSYKRSRDGLFQRMTAAGIRYHIFIGHRGRKQLLFGAPDRPALYERSHPILTGSPFDESVEKYPVAVFVGKMNLDLPRRDEVFDAVSKWLTDNDINGVWHDRSFLLLPSAEYGVVAMLSIPD